jgi:hypothetical protein
MMQPYAMKVLLLRHSQGTFDAWLSGESRFGRVARFSNPDVQRFSLVIVVLELLCVC